MPFLGVLLDRTSPPGVPHLHRCCLQFSQQPPRDTALPTPHVGTLRPVLTMPPLKPQLLSKGDRRGLLTLWDNLGDSVLLSNCTWPLIYWEERRRRLPGWGGCRWRPGKGGLRASRFPPPRTPLEPRRSTVYFFLTMEIPGGPSQMED